MEAEMEMDRTRRSATEARVREVREQLETEQNELARQKEKADEAMVRVRALRKQTRDLEGKLAAMRHEAVAAAGGEALMVARSEDKRPLAFGQLESESAWTAGGITPVLPDAGLGFAKADVSSFGRNELQTNGRLTPKKSGRSALSSPFNVSGSSVFRSLDAQARTIPTLVFGNIENTFCAKPCAQIYVRPL
jgi:hypothetical protein